MAKICTTRTGLLRCCVWFNSYYNSQQDTRKQTPVLLTPASAAPMIQDEATTISACNNPVTTRPMSNITNYKLVANHENTSHGVISEESNVHVLPQDDSPSTPAVKEGDSVVENENLHPVHSSLQEILNDFASLVVVPLPHGQDLSHNTPAVQDQDAAQECQSLPQFQSPIFYSTAQEAPYLNQNAWRMPVGISRPHYQEATSASSQTLFSASLPGVVRILHKMAENILQDVRDHFRNRV